MRSQSRALLLALCAWLAVCSVRFGIAKEEPAVLATVNGSPVTADQWRLHALLLHLPEELTEDDQQVLRRALEDRELIRAFLAKRKVAALPDDVERHVLFVKKGIAGADGDVEAIFSKLGLTEELLRREAALALAWKMHVRRATPDSKIRQHFEQHKAEYDGTQVQARQIVLLVNRDADESAWTAAEEALTQLKQQITSGKITFEAAARAQSQSPSAENGGDVGSFPFRGKMPARFSEVAFATSVGEVAGPLRTPFGVHLLQVTGRTPGDLSLEDSRLDILKTLADELWRTQTETERKAAKIIWQKK